MPFLEAGAVRPPVAIVFVFFGVRFRRCLREIWGAVTNADAAVDAKTRENSAMTIVTVFICATMTVARKGLSCLLR